MPRMLLGAALALGLIACAAQTAIGSSALIETAAPLFDDSEAAVKIAVVAAMDKAVRGATAMGFAWVQLQAAEVLGHEVVIQILASDEDPDEAGESTPTSRRRAAMSSPASPPSAASRLARRPSEPTVAKPTGHLRPARGPEAEPAVRCPAEARPSTGPPRPVGSSPSVPVGSAPAWPD